MSNEPGAVLHGDEVREALALADRLKESPDLNDDDFQILAAEVRRLQSELDRLRGCERDAERYRWLREPLHHTLHFPPPRNLLNKTPEELDAFIDAAIDAATEARTLGTEDEKPFRGTNESGSGIGDSHRRNGGEA
jgi:hypothetical protein